MSAPSNTLEEATHFLRTHDNYLISSHDPLDADAVGSEIALALTLESLGKKTTIINDGAPPGNLVFLPEFERVRNLQDGPVTEKFDVMATVDCGGYKNLRGSLDLLNPGAEIINIDHHAGNEHFGKVNYVDSLASAAGTMVFRIIRGLCATMTPEMAWSLYAALVTDTGRFSYSNTHPETHEMAAEFLRLGVEPAVALQNIYRNKPLALVHLEAAVAKEIDVVENGQIAVVQVTQEMCLEHGIPHREARDLIDIPMQISGVEVAILLREVENELTKVSFRSSGKADVNALAAKFGGGGHKLASGCRLNLPVVEARKTLLAAATEMLVG